jgi:hypothetical protein
MILRDETRTAVRRRKRPCALCFQPVLPGDRVRDYAVVDGREVQSVSEHATCNALAREVYDDWAEDWGEFEMPEDQLEAARRLSAAREAT